MLTDQWAGALELSTGAVTSQCLAQKITATAAATTPRALCRTNPVFGNPPNPRIQMPSEATRQPAIEVR
jgi:hypothetical protein